MGFIAYYRVSTKKQGDSGLGLDAQRAAVKNYTKDIYKEYVEVESGKNPKRPRLLAAIEECKKTGHTLLVAKLDRLARNVHFVSALMESKVPFRCIDMPEADNFTIHIFAALAEREAKLISDRTKAALAELKKQGVKLGCPPEKNKIRENRLNRVYVGPDKKSIERLEKFINDGYKMNELHEMSEIIYGKKVSLATIYNHVNQYVKVKNK